MGAFFCELTARPNRLKICLNKGESVISKLFKTALVGHCACGNVELEVTGEPLLCASCHCGDCHEGSRRIEALPDAPPVLDAFGGTQHMLYRKDRIRYLKGANLLKSLKVDDDSPARVYSSCCNSYLMLEVPAAMPATPIFRGRFQGDIPALEMRINAKFKPDSAQIPSDVPCYRAFPLKFVGRLLSAKIAMLCGR